MGFWLKHFGIALVIGALGLADLSAQPRISQDEPSYRVRAEDTLENISRRRYGNRCYMGLVAIHNELEDSHHLVAGDTLRLPDLATILAYENLTALVGAEMESILAAREAYIGVEPELRTIRRSVPRIPGDPGTPRPVLDLPEHVVASLVTASELLRTAARKLGQSREGVGNPPHHLIGQLVNAADNLDRQARGIQDGYGYDMDLVHQRIALALEYAIIWSREGFE